MILDFTLSFHLPDELWETGISHEAIIAKLTETLDASNLVYNDFTVSMDVLDVKPGTD